MNNPITGNRILTASYTQFGEIEKARQSAQKILSAHPDFSLDEWTKMMPDKHMEDTMHFIEGLSKTGLH